MILKKSFRWHRVHKEAPARRKGGRKWPKVAEGGRRWPRVAERAAKPCCNEIMISLGVVCQGVNFLKLIHAEWYRSRNEPCCGLSKLGHILVLEKWPWWSTVLCACSGYTILRWHAGPVGEGWGMHFNYQFCCCRWISPSDFFHKALTSTVFEVLQCFTNGIHCEKPQFNRGELTTYDWWHIYPHLARTSRFHRQISTKPSPNAAVSTGFTLR